MKATGKLEDGTWTPASLHLSSTKGAGEDTVGKQVDGCEVGD